MALANDRVAELFQKMDRQLRKLSSAPKPNTVHRFRTSARRLEAVLATLVIDPDRNHRKLLKLISKLRRRAGRVRDLDVQIAALRSLKVCDQPASKTELLQAMSEMRAKRERRFLETLDKETVRELRRRLKRMQGPLSQNAGDPWVLARGMLVNFASQNGMISEKILHQYRIEGKKIRYLAELTPEQPDAGRIIAELKTMQDALGEWHDWLTLNATLKKLLPENGNSPLRAAVSNITRAKYRSAVQAVNNAKASLLSKPNVEAKPSTPEKRAAISTPAAATAVA